MSIRGLSNRVSKAAAAAFPKCGPGTRVLREQQYGGPDYQPGPGDECPQCGVIGCGLLVVALVEVGRDVTGQLTARHDGTAWSDA